MVILKNIEKTDHDISAFYYPEGNEKKGFMRINLEDDKIVEHEQSGMLAPSHVRRALIQLGKLENIPNEKTLLWY